MTRFKLVYFICIVVISILKDLFQGKDQPWRLGKFFGDPKFAVGENGEGFEKELNGVVVQPSLKVDRFVTKELINNLFNSKKESLARGIKLKGVISLYSN